MCNPPPAFFRLLILASLMGTGWWPEPIQAAQPVSEAALKAVLLFKLPRFVYWPSPSTHPTICILRAPAFARALNRLAGSSPQQRYEIRHLSNLRERGRTRCTLIFIGSGARKKLKKTLKTLAGSQVLTVSDIPGFARAGGMVEFAPKSEGRGIQILINRRAAREQQIDFNAQLLRLATLLEP